MTTEEATNLAIAELFIASWGRCVRGGLLLQARREVESAASLRNRARMATLAAKMRTPWEELLALMREQEGALGVQIATGAFRDADLAGAPGLSDDMIAHIQLNQALDGLLAARRPVGGLLIGAFPLTDDTFCRAVCSLSHEFVARMDGPDAAWAFRQMALEIRAAAQRSVS